MAEDIQLLRRYAENCAEDAFGALVERHVSFVYSAALRQLGGAACRAEDVTQTVFIHLARHAGPLSHRAEIVGWLYTATHHAAANLKRTEARRQRREQEAHTMHELLSEPAAGADWDHVRPVLDDAMHELSEADRQAILLRFFKSERFVDLGRKLGLSEDGARMRVERALDKLHALLARRGISSTSGALAAALANQAVATAPAGLAASVTGAALTGVATAGGSLAALLAFMTTSKITVSIGAAGALAIVVAVHQSNQARAATKEVARAQLERDALAARFADLEKNVGAAERERAEREAALERLRMEKNAVVAAPTPPAPVDDVNARYGEIVDRVTQNDDRLRKAQEVYSRAKVAETYQPLFSRLGFDPAQIERALDLLVKPLAQARKPDATEGTLDIIGRAAVNAREEFRAAFGVAAAERIAEFSSPETWRAREVVNNLSAKLYFMDAAFTPQQAERLIGIVKETSREPRFPPQSTEKGPDLFHRTRDWDRIQAQAGSFLSPEQQRGLRALVAIHRNSELQAVAVYQSTATPP